MKPSILAGLTLFVFTSFFGLSMAVAAEPGDLEETTIQAYLEKTVSADAGSCLVDDIKIDFIGISDVVPGHRVEVFYRYAYTLRCSRYKTTKSGQGVLQAARLRDGQWIDRETLTIILK